MIEGIIEIRGLRCRGRQGTVERIAGDVARAILARFPRVSDTRVKVTKPHPAGLGADAESVEISLRR